MLGESQSHIAHISWKCLLHMDLQVWSPKDRSGLDIWESSAERQHFKSQGRRRAARERMHIEKKRGPRQSL